MILRWSYLQFNSYAVSLLLIVSKSDLDKSNLLNMARNWLRNLMRNRIRNWMKKLNQKPIEKLECKLYILLSWNRNKNPNDKMNQKPKIRNWFRNRMRNWIRNWMGNSVRKWITNWIRNRTIKVYEPILVKTGIYEPIFYENRLNRICGNVWSMNTLSEICQSKPNFKKN